MPVQPRTCNNSVGIISLARILGVLGVWSIMFHGLFHLFYLLYVSIDAQPLEIQVALQHCVFYVGRWSAVSVTVVFRTRIRLNVSAHAQYTRWNVGKVLGYFYGFENAKCWCCTVWRKVATCQARILMITVNRTEVLSEFRFKIYFLDRVIFIWILSSGTPNRGEKTVPLNKCYS